MTTIAEYDECAADAHVACTSDDVAADMNAAIRIWCLG